MSQLKLKAFATHDNKDFIIEFESKDVEFWPTKIVFNSTNDWLHRVVGYIKKEIVKNTFHRFEIVDVFVDVDGNHVNYQYVREFLINETWKVLQKILNKN